MKVGMPKVYLKTKKRESQTQKKLITRRLGRPKKMANRNRRAPENAIEIGKKKEKE